MKTERALKRDACKADSRYHGWCLVNSMNLLISSIHQKDIFLGEKFLERCEALLTDEDANSSASISMLIIKCHLYWYMNRRDFVLEHIGELIGHLNLISPNDLVQSIQELIFLLKDMEDARAKRGKLCIAIIDIDHFKTHNDTYGHIHGDSTTTKETLFSRADEALYSVKEGGRNNYCIYEE